MACSPARLLANRRNSLKSTGPKSPRGKSVARRNALKHGLTGSGIVIPGEDEHAVARLCDELQPEIAPKEGGAMARILVRRVAVMSVRMDRCVRHETAAIAEKTRTAAAEFDEVRRAKADHLLSWIATEPATNRRQLMAMPEGVELLLASMRSFRTAVYSNCGHDGWDAIHAQRFDECTGRRSATVPVSRCYALSEAILGRFERLGPDDAADLPPRERVSWARDQMAALIDAEIARLEAHGEALDPTERLQSRDEASLRALFDPERDATAARKYEAAAERMMYRALRELKELNQGGAAGTLDTAGATDAVLLYETQADDLIAIPELAEMASFRSDTAEPAPAAEPEPEPASLPRPRPRPRRRQLPRSTSGRLASFCRGFANRYFATKPTKKAEPVGAGSALGWG